jgi:DNA polymerase elongation subunit (family B)
MHLTEVTTTYDQLIPVPPENIPRNLPGARLCYFDIETFSSNPKMMPEAFRLTDVAYLISLVLVDEHKKKSAWLLLLDAPPICTTHRPIVTVTDGDVTATIERFSSELLLIRRFEQLFRECRAQMLVSFNGHSYDFNYLEKRLLNFQQVPGQYGYTPENTEFYDNIWRSSAYREIEERIPNASGVIMLDLMRVIFREYKLNRYNLKSVTTRFLNEDRLKIDLSAPEQFKIAGGGTTEEWEKLLSYSLRDSVCLAEIAEKINLWNAVTQTAAVTGVGIEDLNNRGKQVQVLNSLYPYVYNDGRILDFPAKVPREKYEGALVQDPLIGFHIMVLILDFSSLYPSIIIGYNIGHDTYLTPEQAAALPKEMWMCPPGSPHAFLVKSVRQSALARMLIHILEERARIKKQMGKEEDPIVKGVLDARQAGVKVVANSAYGFLGAADKGILPLPEGAETVTAVGRWLISQVADHLREKYGATIVYGDSVVGDTPLLLRRNGKIEVKSIENLGRNWKKYDEFKPWLEVEKEQGDDIDYEVWTDKGWAKIRRVIRHYTDKKIYEILTQGGMVQVTEDHSLLTPNGTRIGPDRCKIGTELLHSFPKIENAERSMIGKERAHIHGFIFGSGTPEIRRNSLYNWLEDIFRRIVIFLALWLLGNEGYYKSFPSDILNGATEEKEAFLNGYFAGSGSQGNSFSVKGQINAMSMFYLIKSLGYTATIGEREKIFRITYNRNKQRGSFNRIKKIREIGMCNDYVYDLETENGHFQAGVGQIIVHNTDSVFVKFPPKPDGSPAFTCEEAAVKGEELATEITDMLDRKPIAITFENTYFRLLLCGKKGYVSVKVGKKKDLKKPGPLYYPKLSFDELTVKGISLARREITPFAARVVKDTLQMFIIDDKPQKEIFEMIDNHVLKLMTRQVPIEDLIWVQGYTGAFKENSNHAMKAYGLRRIREGKEIKPGERVDLVIIKRDHRLDNGSTLGDRLCDPADLPDDYHPDNFYYLSHKLVGALKALMRPMYQHVLPMKLEFPRSKKQKIPTGLAVEHIETWIHLVKAKGSYLEQIEQEISGDSDYNSYRDVREINGRGQPEIFRMPGRMGEWYIIAQKKRQVLETIVDPNWRTWLTKFRAIIVAEMGVKNGHVIRFPIKHTQLRLKKGVITTAGAGRISKSG